MDILKIDVERLSDAPQEVHVKLDDAWFQRELEGVVHTEHPGEGRAEFRIQKMSGETVHVEGQIQARFSAVCARCLAAAAVVVDEPYFMVFEPVPDPTGLPEDLELSEADIAWEGYRDGIIDLTPQLREQYLLAVPMRPLCCEDCPGIEYDRDEPPPEDEDELDPRWKALAKLKPTR